MPFIIRTAKTSWPFLPRTRRGKSQCGRAGVPSTADLSCEVRLKPWNQVHSKKPGFPKDSRLSAKAWQALGSWISIQMRLLKSMWLLCYYEQMDKPTYRKHWSISWAQATILHFTIQYDPLLRPPLGSFGFRYIDKRWQDKIDAWKQT